MHQPGGVYVRACVWDETGAARRPPKIAHGHGWHGDDLIRADGLRFGVCLEEDRLACLAVMGVCVDGRKEVSAYMLLPSKVATGSRQSSVGSLRRDRISRGFPRKSYRALAWSFISSD